MEAARMRIKRAFLQINLQHLFPSLQSTADEDERRPMDQGDSENVILAVMFDEPLISSLTSFKDSFLFFTGPSTRR